MRSQLGVLACSTTSSEVVACTMINYFTALCKSEGTIVLRKL